MQYALWQLFLSLSFNEWTKYGWWFLAMLWIVLALRKGAFNERTNEYPIRALPSDSGFIVFDMKPIVVRNCRGCFFSKRDWNFIANCRRFTRLYLPSSAASSTPVLLASGFISVAACCCLLHAFDAVQSIVPNYSGFVCCWFRWMQLSALVQTLLFWSGSCFFFFLGSLTLCRLCCKKISFSGLSLRFLHPLNSASS